MAKTNNINSTLERLMSEIKEFDTKKESMAQEVNELVNKMRDLIFRLGTQTQLRVTKPEPILMLSDNIGIARIGENYAPVVVELFETEKTGIKHHIVLTAANVAERFGVDDFRAMLDRKLQERTQHYQKINATAPAQQVGPST